jgi:hypothetical protein
VTPGCSTLPKPSELAPPAKQSCLPPQSYASWYTFTSTTEVVPGESAFTTAKRFRIAEREKNLAGQRLWHGLKVCRGELTKTPQPKPEGLSSFLGGVGF